MPLTRETFRKHRFRWLFLAVWLPLAVLAFFWFGIPPRVQEQAVRAERNDQGDFVDTLLSPADETEKSGISFEAHYGKIAATNNFASSSSTTSGDPSFFRAERLLLINHSDHTLMGRVGELLFERLKQQSSADRIDYFPHGTEIPAGERAPDVFIRLELEEIDESGLIIDHELQAKIVVTASDIWANSHHSYHDNLTPPQLQFDWRGTLEHNSTTTGVSTSSAKYKLAAENIADQIAKTLTKQFDEWRKKHGAGPDLPSAFFPEYRPTEPLAFIEDHAAEQLFTGHGLFNRNQTVWTFQSEAPPNEVIPDIATKLDQAGWDVPEDSLPGSESPAMEHLRAKRNHLVVEVFPHQDSRSLIQNLEKRRTGEIAGPYTYFVTYVDRMSRADIQACVKRLLDQEAPVDTVLFFSGHLHGDNELQQRVLNYLQERPTNSPAALLGKAELLNRLKHTEEAERTLLATYFLSQSLSDPDHFKSRMENLAKTLKLEDFPPQQFDTALLQEHGVIELTPDTKITQREAAAGEPIVFYWLSPDEEIKFYRYEISGGNQRYWEMSYVMASPQDGMRQWGSGGNPVTDAQWAMRHDDLGETHKLRFYAKIRPGGDGVVWAADVIEQQQPEPPPPYEMPAEPSPPADVD